MSGVRNLVGSNGITQTHCNDSAYIPSKSGKVRNHAKLVALASASVQRITIVPQSPEQEELAASVIVSIQRMYPRAVEIEAWVGCSNL
jgi:hypothetical protein